MVEKTGEGVANTPKRARYEQQERRGDGRHRHAAARQDTLLIMNAANETPSTYTAIGNRQCFTLISYYYNLISLIMTTRPTGLCDQSSLS